MHSITPKDNKNNSFMFTILNAYKNATQ